MRSGAGVAGVGNRLAIRRGEFLLQRISANHLENPITLPHLDGITCIVTDSTSRISLDVASFCRLDGKHVVFGKVLSGVDVVFKIEAEGQQSGTPRSKVVVVDSGELPL